MSIVEGRNEKHIKATLDADRLFIPKKLQQTNSYSFAHANLLMNIHNNGMNKQNKLLETLLDQLIRSTIVTPFVNIAKLSKKKLHNRTEACA